MNDPVISVARRVSEQREPGTLLLDSARAAPVAAQRARRSFLFSHPERALTEDAHGFVEWPGGRRIDSPVGWILEAADASTTLAGLLGFEFAWLLDDVAAPASRPDFARCFVGAYPAYAIYDHGPGEWTVHGAGAGADALRAAIAGPAEDALPGKLSELRLDVSDQAYLDGVEAAIAAIHAGELFELNYTERFRARWRGRPFELYAAMRENCTGAYFGYLDTGTEFVASVSPEQFVEVRDRQVTTRPIKGTRRRSDDPREDRALADELRGSAKDRAENVMIVDLMRNDLTRVCEPGSVRASAICELESFAGVHHLVSTVEGRMRGGVSPIEVLLACFPAGSITGAPKLRSLELIAQLEHSPRGPYTGSLFYCLADGQLDSNVLIRTAFGRKDESELDVFYGAGGAVVADSVARDELDEARTKAAPLAGLSVKSSHGERA